MFKFDLAVNRFFLVGLWYRIGNALQTVQRKVSIQKV